MTAGISPPAFPQFISHRPSLFFAAFGAVKQHPHGEVVAEALEPVGLAGGGKQEIARLELLPRTLADILAVTTDDNVSLVAAVRLLRVEAARRVDFELEAAVREQSHKTLAA